MSEGSQFVIQKGKAQCDKGNKFPNFKVTSHTHHYWNGSGNDSGHLAVTEDDTQFNPPVAPFGSCSLNNGNPCKFSALGKWKKTYEQVKVLGKKCVIEESELQCVVGGKITVFTSGQQAHISPRDAEEADSVTLQTLNPLVDIEELQDSNTQDYI